MSEALDKIRGIDHLPLFPLPLVLLPNEFLPLHIFEPRYRQMLEDVESGKRLFGVNFFDSEASFDLKPEIGSVGCVAEIREVQTMPDGRSNILTTGLVRYRIVDYVDMGTPYLCAEVGFFEDDPEEDAILKPVSDEVFALFKRVAKAAFKMSGNRGQFPDIPDAAPEQLSFLVTAAFNLENDLKYQILGMTSTSERLDRLKGILVQAVDQMEASADIFKVAQTNGHSKKKIDL
ncbi:MAG TPA: LON peptidase substrate-binding domain-containing protein [Pyrinomonadaceae bacterium]|nr:LON peptidase substrate-binding domain-containing protein [Pyrinomonadaceae bacterium]HMP64164.1 LON peptidase substrate-binding domain-containing protein [Pyrinomonadaceae bacterium]